ncbi:MAG TPA: hypothetical protein VNJ01_10460 [Bacteriovoracaceae bacterium]|nr:hypothetical protein [Bacteriovoracaceae bacterium]
MENLRDAKIQTFKFTDLKGTHVVSQQDQLQPFEFKTLNGESVTREKSSDETLRSERGFEKKNNFKIDEAVRDSRGHSRQDQSDLELRIEIEVKKRMEAGYQQAYQEGLTQGREEGKQEAFLEHQEILSRSAEDFAKVIDQVKTDSGNFVESNRTEVVEFIKRFTKWIVLKEIDEKVYLEALLEKLILELNARKNLIIKVSKASFKDMPEVLAAVESRLGQLSNVRIEIVPQIKYPGIILESENGLIDGSLESIFVNIDRIFEQVCATRSARPGDPE